MNLKIFIFLLFVCCINYTRCEKKKKILALHMSFEIIQDKFYMYWTYNHDKTIDFLLKIKNKGYFAIGLGSSMTNSDMMIIQINDKNKMYIGDYYSVGEEKPKTDKERGGKDDLDLLDSFVEDGFQYARFRRKLDTGDKNDIIISEKITPMIYAFSETKKNLVYHGSNKGSFNVPLLNQSLNHKKNAKNTQNHQNSFEILKNKFYIYWTFNDNKTIDFLLKIKCKGYFAIGFGKSMIKSDMMIFQINDNNKVYLGDYYSLTEKKPKTDKEHGGKNNLHLLESYFKDDFQHARFRRKLDTGDKYDFTISENLTPMIYAFSETKKSLVYHGKNKGTFNLPLFRQKITHLPNEFEIIKNQFYMHWTFNHNKTIDFILKMRNKGYFAIGFGSSMTKSDMIIFQINGKNEIYSGDYYSHTEEKPKTDKELGGKNNIHLLNSFIKDEIHYVHFRRKLDTGDKNDYVISEKLTPMIYAFSKTVKTLSYHGINRGSFIVPLFNKTHKHKKNERITHLPNSFEFIKDKYYMYWVFNHNKTIDFLLKIKNKGYFAIGLGPSMTKSDMMIIQINDKNKMYIGDYYSLTEEKPKTDKERGGKNNLDLLDSFVEDGFQYARFRRKLDTGDKNDIIISEKITPMIYAFSETKKTLVYHGTNRGTFYVPLFNQSSKHKKNLINQCNGQISRNRIHSLPNSYEIIKDKFYIYWIFNSNQTISFLLKIKNKGYFAIGFGESMLISDMIIVQLNEKSELYIGDYYSTLFVKPKTDKELGGKDNIHLIDSYINCGFEYAYFSRKLNTKDINDFILSEKPTSIIYAFSNSPKLTFHGLNRGQVVIPLYNKTKKLTNSFEIVKDKFFMSWEFNCDKTIEMILKIKNKGYFAIGFGRTMIDSDMIIVQLNKNKEMYINDFYSKEFVKPVTDKSLGGQNNIHLIENFTKDGFKYVHFKRKMNTSDKYDFIISQKLTPMIYAFSDSPVLTYHGFNRGTIFVNLFNKTKTSNNKKIKFLSNSFQIVKDKFFMYWEYNCDESIDFILKIKNKGYFSIGFGETMLKSDMIVVQFNEKKEMYIGDYYSTEFTLPKTDKELGGKDDLLLIDSFTESGFNYVHFNRKLNTGDKNDFIISEKLTPMIYAFS